MIHRAIDRAIRAVIEDFRAAPDSFLTEDDLRCRLFARLAEEDDLSEALPTRNGSLSSRLHAEVRWYGRGNLPYRSDIVILKPETLTTTEEAFELPSKGFHFNLFDAIIETKLRRINGAAAGVFIEELRSDVRRLVEIDEHLGGANPEARFYLVAFDRKEEIADCGPQVLAVAPPRLHPRIEIHYVMRGPEPRPRPAEPSARELWDD